VKEMDFSKLKVLAVDDNIDYLFNVLDEWLIAFGFKRENIFKEIDGERALGVLKAGGELKKKIDLVISDYVMPKKDGLDFLGEIKKDENLKNLPFIMFTSGVKEEDRELFEKSFKDLGGDEIVLKVDIRELKDVIEKVLTAKRGGERNGF
jgi:two-component system chemotaxis response regulator CheY